MLRPGLDHDRRWRWALAAAVGLGAAALRFLATTGFPNDHFIALTRAAQMLHGDWPVRDFVDPGLPLMYAASAAMQLLAGRTLYAEALLVAGAFGLGAGLTFRVVDRWCGSALLGLWAAFAEFAIFPRSYSYPKVLLYVVAAWAFVAYARQPTTARLAGLAAVSLVAFLFRHDHGMFIFAASLVLVAAAGLERGARPAAGAALRLAGLSAAMAAPYFVFLQMHGGLRAYAASALAFSRAEAERTMIDRWPQAAGAPLWSAEALSACGYYLFWSLPLIAAAVLVLERARMTWPQRGVVLACAVLAAGATAAFLRDPLTERLPDAIVPAVLLMAWLARTAWPAATRRLAAAQPARALVAAALVVIAAASATVGAFTEQINRASADRGPAAIVARWREVAGELRQPFNQRHMPSSLDVALVPFFVYVQACTAPTDRMLVTGFAPEVPYYAGRPFAGGQVSLFMPYYSSERDQRALLRRLGAQSVPLVLVPPESAADFASGYRLVHAWVSHAYQLMAEIDVPGQASPAQIYLRRELAGAPALAGTTWPCAARQGV